MFFWVKRQELIWEMTYLGLRTEQTSHVKNINILGAGVAAIQKVIERD